MAFELKHGKFAFSDLNHAKKLIFVDIQHRYSSILLALRGAGFVCNNWLEFLASNFVLSSVRIHGILRDNENFDTY